MTQDVHDYKPLLEKWDPVLNDKESPEIKDPYKRKVTARLLENTQEHLMEDSNLTSGVANWDPVLIKMVRRMAPRLIAYDIMGVQPMSQPTGLAFAIKARKALTPPNTNPQGGAEILGLTEPQASYGGTGSDATITTANFLTSFATGTGIALPTSETAAWNSVGVTISKHSISAVASQLRADYSLEIAQDMRKVHGLEAEAELVNILSSELIAEVNRMAVRNVYSAAKVGAQFASSPGTFDLNADADGRWSVERFKGLLFAIERDANAVAVQSLRGKANFMIVSSDVASALAMAGVLDYAPALAAVQNLEVDPVGATFAGTCGRFKVYIDPYLTVDAYTLGYKGADQYDAGLFYHPYIPLEIAKAVDPVNFHNAIGFKTRYAFSENPLVGDNSNIRDNANYYYRKALVSNLL